MTEERLRVESGPPQQMIDDANGGVSRSTDDVSTVESAKEVAGKAQQVAGPAKEKAKDLAGQAKEHAQAAAGQAKDKAADQVDERSTHLGQQIATQAEAIDGVAEELRRQGKDGPARIAEQAGERVKGVASYLEQTDGEALVSAVADAARENPAVAAAAGAAAGFVAGRVIKASQSDGPSEDETSGRPDEGSV